MPTYDELFPGHNLNNANAGIGVFSGAQPASTPATKTVSQYVYNSNGQRIGVNRVSAEDASPYSRTAATGTTSTGGIGSTTTAMQRAISQQQSADDALSNADIYASRMGSTAGQLRGIGSSLIGQYGQFSGVNSKIAQGAEVPIQAMVDQASTDVHSSFDRSRGIATRNLERYGINPNSGRFGGMQQAMAIAEAAADAGARSRMRLSGEQMNWNRLLQAGQFGQGIASQGISAVQSAGGMYNSAANLNLGIGRTYDQGASEAATYAAYQQGLQDGVGQSQPVVFDEQSVKQYWGVQ